MVAQLTLSVLCCAACAVLLVQWIDCNSDRLAPVHTHTSASPVECDKVTGVCNESLLMLAHYFDCEQMLAQCEAVEMTQVEWAHRATWPAQQCLRRLHYADRYQLQKWKAACIRAIATSHKSMVEEPLIEELTSPSTKPLWDERLVAEVKAAIYQIWRGRRAVT